MATIKSKISLIAVLLALAVVFCAFSLVVFAEEEVPTEETTTIASEETTSAGENDKADEKTGLSVGQIVAIIIAGVIVVALAVFFILVARADITKVYAEGEKVPVPAKFKQGLRNYKSELKKIVWYPWNQVGKSTLVVVVMILLIAAMIGVLDLAFSKGLYALGKLL